MTVEDVIRTHTEGFNRALTTHDLDALSAIYADDYMLVRPDGTVLGKEDVLRDLARGLRITSIELANVRLELAPLGRRRLTRRLSIGRRASLASFPRHPCCPRS
jgi:hypothetical protein